MLASLRATNRSLADTTQIFQSDSPASVLRFSNKLLADRVVGMLLESCLPSREFLEFTFGRLGLFLLKIPPAMLKSEPVSLDIRPAEIFPVAVGGDIDNAQIHAQHALRINGRQRFNLTRGEQIELALDEAQVTFPASPAQQFELPLSSRKRDVLPAPNRPDRDFFALKVIGQNAVVESNRPVGLEGALDRVVTLVSVGHFGDAAHHDLGSRGKRSHTFR